MDQPKQLRSSHNKVFFIFHGTLLFQQKRLKCYISVFSIKSIPYHYYILYQRLNFKHMSSMYDIQANRPEVSMLHMSDITPLRPILTIIIFLLFLLAAPPLERTALMAPGTLSYRE